MNQLNILEDNLPSIVQREIVEALRFGTEAYIVFLLKCNSLFS